MRTNRVIYFSMPISAHKLFLNYSFDPKKKALTEAVAFSLAGTMTGGLMLLLEDVAPIKVDHLITTAAPAMITAKITKQMVNLILTLEFATFTLTWPD